MFPVNLWYACCLFYWGILVIDSCPSCEGIKCVCVLCERIKDERNRNQIREGEEDKDNIVRLKLCGDETGSTSSIHNTSPQSIHIENCTENRKIKIQKDEMQRRCFWFLFFMRWFLQRFSEGVFDVIRRSRASHTLWNV